MGLYSVETQIAEHEIGLEEGSRKCDGRNTAYLGLANLRKQSLPVERAINLCSSEADALRRTEIL